MFHRRERLAKRIENLSHGGYLPVEVPAADMYGKGSHWHIGLKGTDLHINSIAVKVQLGTVEPGVIYSLHELRELRNGKGELVGVVNLENLEARGGDPTKNRF